MKPPKQAKEQMRWRVTGVRQEELFMSFTLLHESGHSWDLLEIMVTHDHSPKQLRLNGEEFVTYTAEEYSWLPQLIVASDEGYDNKQRRMFYLDSSGLYSLDEPPKTIKSECQENTKEGSPDSIKNGEITISKSATQTNLSIFQDGTGQVRFNAISEAVHQDVGTATSVYGNLADTRLQGTSRPSASSARAPDSPRPGTGQRRKSFFSSHESEQTGQADNMLSRIRSSFVDWRKKA